MAGGSAAASDSSLRVAVDAEVGVQVSEERVPEYFCGAAYVGFGDCGGGFGWPDSDLCQLRVTGSGLNIGSMCVKKILVY